MRVCSSIILSVLLEKSPFNITHSRLEIEFYLTIDNEKQPNRQINSSFLPVRSDMCRQPILLMMLDYEIQVQPNHTCPIRIGWGYSPDYTTLH